MKKYSLVVCLVLILTTNTGLLAATVGNLILRKGVVKVHRGSRDAFYRKTGLKIPLQNGDHIQTGANSRVTIHLTTRKDTVELYSSTFFKVTDVGRTSSSLYLAVGKARFQIRKRKYKTRARRSSFRLRTANAMIGVKGTDFVVGVSDSDTNLLTLSGVVSFANVNFPEIEISLVENQASKTGQTTKPTVPVTVPPEIRDSLIKGDSSEGFNRVQFGQPVVALGKTLGGASKKGRPQLEDLETGIDWISQHIDIPEIENILATARSGSPVTIKIIAK